jgi:hypothetical protein
MGSPTLGLTSDDRWLSGPDNGLDDHGGVSTTTTGKR